MYVSTSSHFNVIVVMLIMIITEVVNQLFTIAGHCSNLLIILVTHYAVIRHTSTYIHIFFKL